MDEPDTPRLEPEPEPEPEQPQFDSCWYTVAPADRRALPAQKFAELYAVEQNPDARSCRMYASTVKGWRCTSVCDRVWCAHGESVAVWFSQRTGFDQLRTCDWSALNSFQQFAAEKLGFTEDSWSSPLDNGPATAQATLGLSVKSWAALNAEQRRAAELLGLNDIQFDKVTRASGGGEGAMRRSTDEAAVQKGREMRQKIVPQITAAERKAKHAAQLSKPREQRWVQDASSSTCMVCDIPFSWRLRKHHCRRCGWLVCNAPSGCSQKARFHEPIFCENVTGPDPKAGKHLVCKLCLPEVKSGPATSSELLDLQAEMKGRLEYQPSGKNFNKVKSAGVLLVIVPEVTTTVIGAAIATTAVTVERLSEMMRKKEGQSELERLRRWSDIHRGFEQEELAIRQMLHADADALVTSGWSWRLWDEGERKIQRLLDSQRVLQRIMQETSLGPTVETDVADGSTNASLEQRLKSDHEPQMPQRDLDWKADRVTLLLQVLARKDETIRMLQLNQIFAHSLDAAPLSQPGRSHAAAGGSSLLAAHRIEDRISSVEETRRYIFDELAKLGEPVPRIYMTNLHGWPEQVMTAQTREKHGVPLRILTIDGGGIKGLAPSILLEKCEELCAPHMPHQLFDLVCGTSTGGILALGTCLARVPACVMSDVYQNRASKIWIRTGGDVKAKYSADGLEQILQESSMDSNGQPIPLLQQDSLRHERGTCQRNEASPQARVFVVAAEKKQVNDLAPPYKKLLLRSYEAPRRLRRVTSQCLLWEAGRATSAAPTYFEPYHLSLASPRSSVGVGADLSSQQFPQERTKSVCCVDGGVIANNPIEIALSEAQELWPDREVGTILSLGCGACARSFEEISGGLEGLEGMSNSSWLALPGLAKVAKEQLTSCQVAHEEVLEMLLGDVSADMHPDEYNFGGIVGAAKSHSPHTFVMACNKGLLDVVQQLLASGADPNSVGQGSAAGVPAIYTASQKGHAAVVELLINSGADIDNATTTGVTPLIIAAYCGHAEVVHLLVAVGADLTPVDKNGKTALLVAQERGHEEIASLLQRSHDEWQQERRFDRISRVEADGVCSTPPPGPMLSSRTEESWSSRDPTRYRSTNYLRLNPSMKEYIPMDTIDPKQLRQLREQTELFLLADGATALHKLERLVEQFKREENAAAAAGWGRDSEEDGRQVLHQAAEGVPPQSVED